MTRKRETVAQIWERIFEDYNILSVIKEEGLYNITADTIRQYKEPRLMTKFDFGRTLPKVFKTNDLGILPIDNGEYAIGNFKLYQQLPKIKLESIKEMNLPGFLTTIDPDNIYSEANALHAANAAGILKDFTGSDLIETISGRMRQDAFQLSIKNSINNTKYNLDVKKPQIEIDGGYESKDHVVLIEAKNKLSEDFIIRQLYYPMRYWANRTHKKIRNLFMVYDNSVFTLYEYNFDDIFDYNSLKLIKSKNYSIKYPDLIPFLNEITQLIKPSIDDSQSDIPFLQANSMNSLINVITELNNKGIFPTHAVSDILEYDKRQGAYYVNAGRYLELIEKISNNKYKLTALGEKLGMSQSTREINKLIITQMVKHPIFHDAISNYVNTGDIGNVDYYEKLIERHKIKINPTTKERRANSLRSWLLWVSGSNV